MQPSIIFNTSRSLTLNIVNNPNLLEVIPNIVSQFHNDLIMASPSQEEVKAAVFSLNPLSAPSPDGLTAHFYLSCWDIYKAAVAFFQRGLHS